MSPEEISKLDAEMKQQNAIDTLLDVDRLFFSPDDKLAILRFKTAVQGLSQAKNKFSPETLEIWDKYFNKQVRSSVDWAKNSQE